MRLPVGSVVFVSHRQVCEGVLLCKFFRQKIFPDQRKTEQFFSMKPNLQSQKPRSYLCLLKREKRPPGWGTAYGGGFTDRETG